MSKIRIANGPYRGREKTLIDKALTIGRDAEAGIQILDRSASRFHAEIFPVGGMFFVRDLDANGAGLGGGDMVVRERPGLLRADGEGGNPVARVVGHVIGGALGLTATRDASQLMAMGTTGIGLDPTSARSARAAATQIHGAKTFGEAVSAGVFPDAVAAIRARTAPSLRAQ